MVAKQQLTAIRGLLDQLETTIATNVRRLHPGQSVQAALDLAESGAVLELHPGAYEGALTFRRPVTVRPTVPVPPGRRARDFEPVTLLSAGETVRIFGPDVTLSGLAYRSTAPLATILTIATGAERTVLDRPLVLGDPIKGQRRGIRADGTGTRLLGAYVDDCFLPAKDTQAVYGANGTRDLLIDDGYFAGGAETIMFGGEDSLSPELVPRDVLITNSTLTKNPQWIAMGAQVKNAFELKAAINVIVRDCEFGFAGIAEGQVGAVCVLTPRNQNNTAPWSTVQHVLLERIRAHHGGAVVTFLGTDDKYQSGPLADVTLREWTVTDIDPLDPVLFPGTYKGSGRLLQFTRGPKDVTIEQFTVTGKNLKAGAYFMGTPPTGLAVRHVTFPSCSYNLKIDNGGQGLAAVKTYAPDSTWDDLTIGGQRLA